MICTRFSGHRFKIEYLSFHHGCFPEFRGRHPFCFRLDPAVIVIVDIISNSFGECFKGRILILDESPSGLDGQNYAPDRRKAEKRGAERQNHSRDHPRQGADRELLR